jgi:hypothetical protein
MQKFLHKKTNHTCGLSFKWDGRLYKVHTGENILSERHRKNKPETVSVNLRILMKLLHCNKHVIKESYLNFHNSNMCKLVINEKKLPVIAQLKTVRFEHWNYCTLVLGNYEFEIYIYGHFFSYKHSSKI